MSLMLLTLYFQTTFNIKSAPAGVHRLNISRHGSLTHCCFNIGSANILHRTVDFIISHITFANVFPQQNEVSESEQRENHPKTSQEELSDPQISF